MWKLIRLFSLLLVSFAVSQQISKEFDVSLELRSSIYEEKPRLMPPERLVQAEVKEEDLSGRLLEPPKALEFAQIKPVEKSGVSCGEPKDALSYRLGVDYYLKGRYEQAEEELGRVLLVPNSPFKPMAAYVLGIIAFSKGQGNRALELFKNSCQLTHMYQKPACEAYYALSFMLKGTVPENKDPLWQAVRLLKEGKEAKPQCEGAVFSQYCSYVLDFSEGRENQLYRDSTSLRKALLLYREGKLENSASIFSNYASPGKPYREIALYYLALIEHKRNRQEQAIKYASILETLDRSLAGNIYALLSEKDLYLARLTYTLTKNPKFLENAGILAYNSKDYALAFINFMEAGNTKYAVYSLIRAGDYKRAVGLLRDKMGKDREEYLWLLEALYWSGEDMEKALSEVAKSYPELYREYAGWDRFRRGDWLGALSFFEEPYYKALCLYNLKKYGEVISLLQGRTDRRSMLLKAKSALMEGNTKQARSFLTEGSDEELYLLGISYFLEGNYAKAVSYFERVSDKSPVKPKALLKAGDSYYNMKETESAKAKYYEVIRKFPESEAARQATLALLEMGGKALKEEEMESLIKSYLEKEKNPAPEIIYQLANIYIAQGKTAEAEKELLRLLETDLKYKAILKLAEIEKEQPKKLVLLYKVYKEAELQEDRKKAREELIKIYSSVGDRKSIADLLAEGEREDKVKAMGMYIGLGDLGSAQRLAEELIRENYRSQEFENYLLELYRSTGKKEYLEYLKSSKDESLRGWALYLSGLERVKGGNKKQALEELVEVVIKHKKEPYYNQAVLESARILIELGAKRDASCMLDRFDINMAKPEEIEGYNKLKGNLPKCEVR
jgi:TolA-binding protein